MPAPTSCACGSRLYRHGKTGRFVKLAGERLRCPSCGKTMTIRNGEVSTIIGRPRKER